ncbi:hypothetical protein PspLS_10151 [Pyricularia sp. CBS 133598]|nr:hypothetical protein PspLS_10151 [Pyricularia sp. CBS 133598]
MLRQGLVSKESGGRHGRAKHIGRHEEEVAPVVRPQERPLAPEAQQAVRPPGRIGPELRLRGYEHDDGVQQQRVGRPASRSGDCRRDAPGSVRLVLVDGGHGCLAGVGAALVRLRYDDAVESHCAHVQVSDGLAEVQPAAKVLLEGGVGGEIRGHSGVEIG